MRPPDDTILLADMLDYAQRAVIAINALDRLITSGTDSSQ